MNFQIVKQLVIVCGATVLGSFLMEGTLRAESSSLTLLATGDIKAPPTWTSADGQILKALPLSFDLATVEASPNSAVESAPVEIKLEHAAQYPASVSLMRPTGCKIGATSIQDAHVQLVHNGTSIGANGLLAISSNAAQRVALRFAADGGYGDKSGKVGCAEAGLLTYAY